MLDKYQTGNGEDAANSSNGFHQIQVSSHKPKSHQSPTVISKDNIIFSNNPKNAHAVSSPQGGNFNSTGFQNQAHSQI